MGSGQTNAQRWAGAGPGGSNLVGWISPTTGKQYGTDDPQFGIDQGTGRSGVIGAIPVWDNSGGGGGGGDGGGGGGGGGGPDFSGLDEFIAQSKGDYLDLSNRSKGIEDFLQGEFKAYISGQRGLGEDFIQNTLGRQQYSLNRQRDLMNTQTLRSANQRGVFRSNAPSNDINFTNRAALEDLGNVEKDIRTQTALTNLDQKRFGVTGMQGLGQTLRGASAIPAQMYTAGTLGRFQGDLNYNLAQQGLGLSYAQLGQQGSEFQQGLSSQNLWNQQQQNFQQQQLASQQKGGLMGGIGSLGGTLGGAAILSSDIRLKENINFVEKKNGISIVEFNYRNDPSRRFRGVIAQDILLTHPEAVVMKDGYYAVNYSKLGIDMEEVIEGVKA